MRTSTDHHSFILKPSTIPGAGVGVFALHDIATGTHLALFAEDVQEEIRDKKDIPEALQIYCIFQGSDKLLCPKPFNRMDIGNYLNHSESKNATYHEGQGYFAVCDIKVGEEILIDYRELGEPEDTREEYYK